MMIIQGMKGCNRYHLLFTWLSRVKGTTGFHAFLFQKMKKSNLFVGTPYTLLWAFVIIVS